MQNPVVDIVPGVAPVSIRWETETGFFRQVREPGADLADLPPPLRAQIEAHWTPELVAAWQAAIDDALQPSAPTAADVVAERSRRLALGFDFDFGDARGVHRLGTSEQDLAGWREVTDLAGALLAMNLTTTPITIVTDTGPVQVTPGEWQAILIVAAAFRQPIWAASFTLQAMDPIPADFAADGYWPA